MPPVSQQMIKKMSDQNHDETSAFFVLILPSLLEHTLIAFCLLQTKSQHELCHGIYKDTNLNKLVPAKCRQLQCSLAAQNLRSDVKDML
jgi:hypothetical protein